MSKGTHPAPPLCIPYRLLKRQVPNCEQEVTPVPCTAPSPSPTHGHQLFVLVSPGLLGGPCTRAREGAASHGSPHSPQFPTCHLCFWVYILDIHLVPSHSPPHSYPDLVSTHLIYCTTFQPPPFPPGSPPSLPYPGTYSPSDRLNVPICSATSLLTISEQFSIILGGGGGNIKWHIKLFIFGKKGFIFLFLPVF